MNRTTSKKKVEVKVSTTGDRKPEINVRARRATEYRMKIRYPFTVLSAPFVLALPFVVLPGA